MTDSSSSRKLGQVAAQWLAEVPLSNPDTIECVTPYTDCVCPNQIVSNIASDGKSAAGADLRVVATLTTGTGKYAGISGGFKFLGHGPEFRTAAEGTYVQYGTTQGSYKLP